MIYRGSRWTRVGKAGIDLGVLAAAFVLAFQARFEGAVPPPMRAVLLASLPLVVLLQYSWCAVMRVPRCAWRCVSIADVRRTLYALTAAGLTLACVRAIAEGVREAVPFAGYLNIPLGVLLIDFALSMFGLLGVRVAWRLWTERREGGRIPGPRGRALLVGTGRSSVLAVRAITDHPLGGLTALGFLGEHPDKVGMVLQGLPVVATIDRLREVAADMAADQILIPMHDISPETVRQIIAQCEGSGATARVIPGPGETGGDSAVRVREVTIEDLLRRNPVQLNGDAVAGVVQDRAVLVSGAGGSIGSELCRQVCRFHPRKLILLEQAENNLFQIHRQLAQEFPDVRLVPAVADVCDAVRVGRLLALHRPAVIFHAAAHKHVPMMEWNPGEAVKNNVLGTRTLADLADEHGVGEFVMVSTDKAVNPTSVMGVSKRVAELYIQALARRSRTRYVAVRFGNVLGSAGSVIPIFREQIARGGPVTVTHPDMKRYFMTIPEACQLILEAASLGQGGEIFVLDMGEPVRIVDLAYDLIRLSGLTPGKDIEVRFTGMRPGEKLYEELALTDENANRTRHPRIFTGRLNGYDWDDVRRRVEELGQLADCGDPARIRARFKTIVPEYACDPATGGEGRSEEAPREPALRPVAAGAVV
ncbi:MAG: polysaccharide biosynthesis protein [Gemmataceae bacterium]|nr:polysaccharide biosynthesis protein [Gemmataceae bacterium]